MCLAALSAAGCSEAAPNQPPELRGVADISCLVYDTVDLLDGVSALDLEQGDLTPELKISIVPHVDVEDGRATFKEAGEYEVCYEIRDRLGLAARSVAYVTCEERETYSSSITTNGFSSLAGGGAKIIAEGANGGAYSLKSSGAQIAEDIKLTRTYALITGVNYIFRYRVNSSVAGKISIGAEGVKIGEAAVLKGESTVEFTHKLPEKTSATGERLTENTQIELWLGSLGEEIDFSLSEVEVEYPQQNIVGFDFAGRVENRDDNPDASVEVAEGGKAATFKVAKAAGAGNIWRQSMFIDTGVNLVSGATYKISFDLESKKGNPFDILVQHDSKFNDGDAKRPDLSDLSKRIEYEFTADLSFGGRLWLNLRSGEHENEITISNLNIEISGANARDYYKIDRFTPKSYDRESVREEYGKVIYTAASFGYDWGDNEMNGPKFSLEGAAETFVISMKVKASAPTRCKFVATLASEWKTFAESEFLIPVQESVIFIKCGYAAIKDLDGSDYKFLWQFGNGANVNNKNTTIEISEIKICLA